MLNNAHALPRWMGIFLLILGVIFFINPLAIIHIFTIPELWNDVIQETGWSYFMIGWAFASITIIAIIFGVGADILYYHDKHSEPKEQKDYKDWNPE